MRWIGLHQRLWKIDGACRKPRRDYGLFRDAPFLFCGSTLNPSQQVPLAAVSLGSEPRSVEWHVEPRSALWSLVHHAEFGVQADARDALSG